MNTNWIKRPWVANTILVSGGVIFALALGEIALRIMLPVIEPPQIEVTDQGAMLRPDPFLVWKTVPNAPGLDANGFKNARALATATVVTLGDSHTFGGFLKTGEKDLSWPAVLGDTLAVPVYNMGVWGYGFAQYAYLFKSALSLSPKVIVVGVYMGNDVFDTYDTVYHAEGWTQIRDPHFEDSTPVTAASQKQLNIPLRGVRDFLRAHSVLYKFLGDRTRLWREEVGISKARDAGVHDWTTTDPEVSLIYDATPSQKTLFWAGYRLAGVDANDHNIQEGLRLAQTFLVEMKQQARKQDVTLVLAFLPTKMSAYAPLVTEAGYARNKYFDQIIHDETELKQDLSEVCTDGTVICIDTLPALQQALQLGEKIYPETWDEHPLASGYRVYADAIAKGLRGAGSVH